MVSGGHTTGTSRTRTLGRGTACSSPHKGPLTRRPTSVSSRRPRKIALGGPVVRAAPRATARVPPRPARARRGARPRPLQGAGGGSPARPSREGGCGRRPAQDKLVGLHGDHLNKGPPHHHRDLGSDAWCHNSTGHSQATGVGSHVCVNFITTSQDGMRNPARHRRFVHAGDMVSTRSAIVAGRWTRKLVAFMLHLVCTFRILSTSDLLSLFRGHAQDWGWCGRPVLPQHN